MPIVLGSAVLWGALAGACAGAGVAGTACHLMSGRRAAVRRGGLWLSLADLAGGLQDLTERRPLPSELQQEVQRLQRLASAIARLVQS